VPFQSPERIAARAQLLTVLGHWCRNAAPDEACALLIGHRCGALWRLQRLWPCCNIWPDPAERSHRFAIDPREQLLAQRWARGLGLELLGSAHSHPASAPLPSATDRALTAPPALMLIWGPLRPGAPARQQCWWLDDPPAAPRPLEWTMEP
jgi:proteasome lid subunit RPN8/RPN11